ncbi:MAG: FtsW/RodA/SpoVE family cell cycle protein [Eubacteriales bacterium]|nr:FtsW/RodA/SpoVE family cell cycle protein [Eubacteriales bacterium]
MSQILKSLDRYVRTIDYFLLVVSMICTGFGMMLIYSATAALQEGSGRFVTVQSIAIILGLIGFIIMSCIRLETITPIWRIALVFNLLFQLSLLLFGYEDGGNRSWLRFAGIGIQPGEIGKLLFIFTFAKQANLYRKQINHWKSIVFLCAQLGVMVLAIVIPSHDFGVALSYVFIAIAILFAAGLSLKWFAAGIAVIAAAFPVLWHFLSTTQRNRILVLFDPSISPDTYWQQEQSRIAIGAGRLFGQGYMNGSQTQYNMLPEKQTDFIFSVAGEEWGMVGCLLILFLLNLLIFRVFYVAYQANGQFLTLVCTGVGSMILYQTYVNIFMCLGIGPVMGLPLPFFSYGGSSMVTSFLAVGIVAGISMRTKQRKKLRLHGDPPEEEAILWDASAGEKSAGVWTGSLKTLRQKTEKGLKRLPKGKALSLARRKKKSEPTEEPAEEDTDDM